MTIDDAPTKITPRIVDYLRSKGIVPVINFMGIKVEKYFEEAVYVAKNGIVIGNHSFSHPHFSEISLEECRTEIEKTEQEIDRVYRAAYVKREHRVFRFPYGDKGGEQAPALQEMLRDEFGFEKLDDSEVRFRYWRGADIDMLWTFDFVEYELPWNNSYTWDSIVRRIHDAQPEMGDVLLREDSTNIILMHDMEETDAFLEKYDEKLIDHVLSCGVEFVTPRFAAPKAKA